MAKNLTHKNYEAEISYSAEDHVFFGKILGINDLVAFEGSTTDELKQSFFNAVDDYLQTCQELGKEPDKVYKGVFNVRVKPEIHRKLAYLAQQENTSLNHLVEESLIKYTESK